MTTPLDLRLYGSKAGRYVQSIAVLLVGQDLSGHPSIEPTLGQGFPLSHGEVVADVTLPGSGRMLPGVPDPERK